MFRARGVRRRWHLLQKIKRDESRLLDGWGGADCSIAQETVDVSLFGCPSKSSLPCSGHGTCNYEEGICYCNNGWSSADCHIPPPLKHCAEQPGIPCNGKGICRKDGTCGCECGFTWELCQYGPLWDKLP